MRQFNVLACCCPRWLCGGTEQLCCCRCPRCAPCDLEEHERPGRVLATDCCCYACLGDDQDSEQAFGNGNPQGHFAANSHERRSTEAISESEQPAPIPYPGTSTSVGNSAAAAALAAEAIVDQEGERERDRRLKIESRVFCLGWLPESIFTKDPLDAPAPVLSWR